MRASAGASPLPALVLAVAAGSVQAQTGLDTSVSLRTDAWSGDRLLNDRGALAAASAWGRAKLDLGTAGQVLGQGWVRDSTRFDGAPHGRVRELYWRGELGPVGLRVGRQMLVWGKADGLNPTDNLSPRDFTLLVPEDADQRRGADAVSASIRSGHGDVTLVWMPKAASHRVPLRDIPGVRYVVDAPPGKPQWALKWEGQGAGIDWSVSYFNGYDPWPDLNVEALSSAGVKVALRNQRARILGADLSWAREGVVWRAEAAWMHTDSEGGQDFRHKKPQFWGVGGGEWSLPDDTTLGVQLTAKHVFDFALPDASGIPVEREVARIQAATAGQTARNQAGVVWRLARRWNHDKLRAEASGILLGPGRNGVGRAKVEYSMTDQLTLQAGVVAPFGPAESSFGQLRTNRLAFVQLRYGFAAEKKFSR